MENTENVKEEIKYLGPGTQLFYEEIDRYKQILGEDLKKAKKIYGFTLFHSLDSIEKVELKDKMGFKPKDAVDCYNYGTYYLDEKKWNKAIEYLSEAVKMDKGLKEAYYNLAIAYESSNDNKNAKKYWETYISLTDDDKEKKEIGKHITELSF